MLLVSYFIKTNLVQLLCISPASVCLYGRLENLIDVILQDRQRVVYEEQKKLVQQQAQTKAQMARYEDELARKRMQVRFVFFYFHFNAIWCLLMLGGGHHINFILYSTLCRHSVSMYGVSTRGLFIFFSFFLPPFFVDIPPFCFANLNKD
jgi:Domain of unknown function (DUF3523)